MMSGGIQSIKLAVQHVGKPGQRVPVGGMDMGKCPDDPLERQALGDHRIIIHVILVVVVNKLVSQRLAENGKRDRGQHKAKGRHRPALIFLGDHRDSFNHKAEKQKAEILKAEI